MWRADPRLGVSRHIPADAHLNNVQSEGTELMLLVRHCRARPWRLAARKARCAHAARVPGKRGWL